MWYVGVQAKLLKIIILPLRLSAKVSGVVCCSPSIFKPSLGRRNGGGRNSLKTYGGGRVTLLCLLYLPAPHANSRKIILAAEPARGLLIFELRAFQGVQTLTNRSKANVNKLTGSCMCRCYAKPHQRSNPVRNRHQRSPFA